MSPFHCGRPAKPWISGLWRHHFQIGCSPKALLTSHPDGNKSGKYADSAVESFFSLHTKLRGNLSLWQKKNMHSNFSLVYLLFILTKQLSHKLLNQTTKGKSLLRKAKAYLLHPGVFSILELAEAVGQRRTAQLGCFGLLQRFARELCQSEHSKRHISYFQGSYTC